MSNFGFLRSTSLLMRAFEDADLVSGHLDFELRI
jgi:hypothetical protein